MGIGGLGIGDWGQQECCRSSRNRSGRRRCAREAHCLATDPALLAAIAAVRIDASPRMGAGANPRHLHRRAPQVS